MTRVALVFAILVCVVPIGVRASGATFVAASANPGTRFATAPDFNTVAVSLADPGSPLRGTAVALAATAASDRGIASVRFQTSPAGASTWTDACTATTAPYSCAFDTTAVADGLRDVRAVALDQAGYSRSATVASRRIDNTAPQTALTDPGTPLTGAVSLAATASDAGAGLATLTLQRRPAGGGAWTDVCQRSASPASCSLDTATLADGLYDFRSVAADAAGNTATAVVADRRVDNTAPTIAFTGPGAVVRGDIVIASTPSDGAGTGIASVRYEFRAQGGGGWTEACVATSAPFSCGGDTTDVPDGVYEARAIVTDGVGLTTVSATAVTRIDNTEPATAILTDPGATLSGTRTLAGTATDTGSGIASLRYELAPTGTTSWTTACSATSAPYSCSWDTTDVADGRYDLRVVATDVAGNTRASSTVANRLVDNGGPTVALADPGSPLRRTVALTATATDPSGVASVTVQRRATGSSGSWTTICSGAAGAACSWNTSTVSDGAYDLRATAVDALGRSTTSATVAARVVDNTAPTATDVQAVNGTGTAGRMDSGDTLTFSYSEAMSADSILGGWTGAQIAVTVRVTDASSADRLSVYNQANTSRLALTSSSSDLQLRADRTSSAGATFAATATMTGSTVVIRLGALTSGSVKTVTAGTTTPMIWTPSTSATDVAGNACASTAVTESGTADRDF